jgi:hypothetical protein
MLALTPRVLVTNMGMLLIGNTYIWGTPIVASSQIKQSVSVVMSQCWVGAPPFKSLEKIYV